jgi:hypothetical protein
VRVYRRIGRNTGVSLPLWVLPLWAIGALFWLLCWLLIVAVVLIVAALVRLAQSRSRPTPPNRSAT